MTTITMIMIIIIIIYVYTRLRFLLKGGSQDRKPCPITRLKIQRKGIQSLHPF